MPTLRIYRLFISHAWRYSEGYLRMIDFLDRAGNFEYRNYSVPRDDAFDRMSKKELEEEIRDQIRPVHVVIILSGMYVSHSDWIQFEINFAKFKDKPVLGVRPWAAQRMPQAVIDAADEIVGWNTDSIISAIRRLA